MPPSKLMQKLRKEHAKQVKKYKSTPRNNANIKVAVNSLNSAVARMNTAVKNNTKNLNAAVAKMKAVQKKLNDKKKARSIKVISPKK